MKGRARQRSWIARERISKSDYLALRADSSEGRRPEAESKSLICGSRLVFSHVSAPTRTLPESNYPTRSRIENPFFCIHKTPPLSLSTVFPPKAEALSHRAVRGLYNSASNQNSEGRRDMVGPPVRSICSGFSDFPFRSKILCH